MRGSIPIHVALSSIVGGYVVFVRCWHPETGEEVGEPHSFGTLDNAFAFMRGIIEGIESTAQQGAADS